MTFVSSPPTPQVWCQVPLAFLTPGDVVWTPSLALCSLRPPLGASACAGTVHHEVCSHYCRNCVLRVTVMLFTSEVPLHRSPPPFLFLPSPLPSPHCRRLSCQRATCWGWLYCAVRCLAAPVSSPYSEQNRHRHFKCAKTGIHTHTLSLPNL